MSLTIWQHQKQTWHEAWLMECFLGVFSARAAGLSPPMRCGNRTAWTYNKNISSVVGWRVESWCVGYILQGFCKVRGIAGSGNDLLGGRRLLSSCRQKRRKEEQETFLMSNPIPLGSINFPSRRSVDCYIITSLRGFLRCFNLNRRRIALVQLQFVKVHYYSFSVDSPGMHFYLV